MASRATAVDIGSRSARAMVVEDGKHGLAVKRFVTAAAEEFGDELAASRFPAKDAVSGLSGRQMTLRYTQVPPSPDWQLRNLMDLEIQDMASQSGGELSADYNLLPIDDEEGGTETVLLALARNEALDENASVVTGAGGSIGAHVPSCIALYNAWLRCGPVEEDATVCIANLGHDTIDLAIMKGTDLLAVRNLSQGGKVFDDAIASAFDVSPRKAESLKKELLDLDPFSRGRYASGQAEKVTVAAGGAGSMIVSAIQSSLMFCRRQTNTPDLELDKLLICGGTARARGIAGMLREALRCPVELYDPFETVDLSALPAEEFDQLESQRYEAVIALGLAAGRLDGKLYQLEILPEAVKRRRKLLGQTVWNVGAGVVAGALLFGLAGRQRELVGDATLANRRLAGAASQQQAVHSVAEEYVARNAELRALIGDLAQRAVPLDGTILTLRALQRSMPSEIWLKKLEVQQRTNVGGRDRRGRSSSGQSKPVIVVDGLGKDVTGGGVLIAYQQFVAAMKGVQYRGVTPEVETRYEQDAQNNTEFTLTIDYRPDPVVEETEEN